MAKLTKDWLVAALIRALRTFAQVALGFITVGMAISDVDWLKMLSVSAVAAVYSVLMSILSGLPEASSDGTLVIDDTDAEKTNYSFEVATPLEDIPAQKAVRLNVEVRK